MGPAIASVTIVLFVCLLPERQTLEWNPSTTRMTSMSVCQGHNVTFNWMFKLRPWEIVEEIRWLYNSGTSEILVAMFALNKFVTLPAFHDRVIHNSDASVTLQHVRLDDAGNYSVLVTSEQQNRAQVYTEISHTLTLSVAAAPSTPDSTQGLEMRQKQQAVYDVATDTYSLLLTCGFLDYPGYPPVTVTWQTPSGSQQNSNYVKNGTFYLLLKSPVQGGNYSCRLPTNSPATACLPRDHPLLGETTLYVDGVMARLTLLEAKEEVLKQENRGLQKELNQTKTSVTQTQTSLQQTQVLLNQTNTLLQQTMDTTLVEVRQQLDLVKEDTFNITHNLLHTINASLQHFRDKAALHVNFQVKRPTNSQPGKGDTLLFNYIYSNLGQGYNVSTGQFTAPVSGDYVFLVTTSGCNQSHALSGYDIMVEGVRYMRAMSQYSITYNPVTGHVVVHLDEGEKVWVEAYAFDLCFADFSTFSGFLLHPDW